MPDIDTLVTMLDGMSPGERSLLEPLMAIPAEAPAPLNDPRVDRCTLALLNTWLSVGFMQLRPVFSRDGTMDTLVPGRGIAPTLWGNAAWDKWARREEEGIYMLPDWLHR